MVVLFTVLLVAHGLIHLLGFAKAFRLAELPELTQPISAVFGVLWLIAGLLFLAAAACLTVWPRWWWMLGVTAVAISMVAMIPSWADARVGAIANAIVVSAAIAGFLVHGPWSLQTAYESDVDRGLARAPASRPVEETDLAHLPVPVQRYLRVSGVVGRPRVYNMRVRMHGRIRSGPDARWLPFRVEQHNVFGPEPVRLFYMTGTMFGIPFHGLHRYAGPSATMRVKVAGVVTVADGAGPEMTRSETVTLFNDMCVMAPATLVDRSIVWDALDDRTVGATFTNAGHTIRAELRFNDEGELTDYRSDDRSASPDGTSMTPMRWSTPLTAYRSFGGVRLASRGQGRWHAPGGEFAYIDLEIDEIRYNVARREQSLTSSRALPGWAAVP